MIDFLRANTLPSFVSRAVLLVAFSFFLYYIRDDFIRIFEMADQCCNRSIPANPNIKCSTHIKTAEVQITLFRPYCPPDLNIVAVKAVHSNDQDYPCRWYIEYKFQQSMSEAEYENYKIRRVLRRELEEWKPKNTLILAENLIKETGEYKWLVEYGVFCLCNRHQVFSLFFKNTSEAPANILDKYCE